MHLSYLNNLLEIIQSEIMWVGNKTTNMEIMKKTLETKDNSSNFWRPMEPQKLIGLKSWAVAMEIDIGKE